MMSSLVFCIAKNVYINGKTLTYSATINLCVVCLSQVARVCLHWVTTQALIGAYGCN